jgi:hypothetical protein
MVTFEMFGFVIFAIWVSIGKDRRCNRFVSRNNHPNVVCGARVQLSRDSSLLGRERRSLVNVGK